ncbi:hypothetical protein MHLP_04470 [Candidatus Mycoplasma haematolamae str. Purdue]|uniref:Uncharacterized protein n=1 Tax=Mycoplasma haematolamae (strain Purdue) TaxID=1212765 RepID=I7CKU7_MYCHA|nr:hypothetical protein [Candidatus Mycoplasma haematolamae]AFO52474.1 hypothetical protein MHLP_04470 [Candidatus Mycoplasma haematolamae str. Purdue]
MSFLLDFLPFYSASTASAVIVGIGACPLLAANFYLCREVWLFKRTTGIQLKFVTFLIVTSLLMGVGAAIDCKDMPQLGAVFLFINVVGLMVNTFVYKQKTANMKAAKEANMSEAEYYDTVIAPSLVKK